MMVYLVWIMLPGEKEKSLWRIFKERLEAIKEKDCFNERDRLMGIVPTAEITEEEVWE